ncbi:MAG: T9SS type A sorting domain-containing protein [Flavobacteriales bacterium]|nr:T9SS type A sorting domain-containing protein [Flavobacteriales bacterium]
MKTLLLLIPFTMMGISNLNAQCTPVDCSAELPPYGGTCDSMLMGGDVNVPYDDFESFVMNNDCFDAGVFDPGLAGTDIKINLVHDITFASLPAGITGVTNQPSYATSAGVNTLGCASFTGTPTEIGVFNGTIDLLVDVTVCGFIPIDLTDQNAQYVMWLTVNPDPTFTGLGSTYCSTDAAVNLNITGTTGGTFSGPGVTGSTFDPAAAGAGMHTIKYLVSAMEGAAIAAASDSMEVVVVVSDPQTYYVDADNDGYGAGVAITDCNFTTTGYSLVDTDCDDGDGAINPGALEILGNAIDENCDGSLIGTDADNDGFDSSLDCDDNDDTVYPGATELCDGKDNDCNSLVDDGLTFTDYFTDADNDGFGTGTASSLCADPGVGFALVDTDCDDTDASINPGATEIPGNSIDEDCDGVDGALGIEEGSLSTLNAYPNPTENVLFISGLEGLTNSISVMNSNGQVITSHSNIDSPIYEMNVENLESGIYFVRINQNNNSKVIRFVKK